MFKFNLFAKKQKETQAAPITPAPSEKDYELGEKEAAAFTNLEADENGMVGIGDVTHGLLHQQPQYIATYLDKSSTRVPFLGEGLRFKADSYSHHDYTIHKDDVLEFVARVKANRRK